MEEEFPETYTFSKADRDYKYLLKENQFDTKYCDPEPAPTTYFASDTLYFAKDTLNKTRNP